MDDGEKIFKTMGSSGAASLAIGIITVVSGITLGTVLIVNGAMLLSGRKNVLF